MTGKYKLTYFNARARAEISRLIFALAKVQYEDVRISGAQWGQLKPTTPAGHLPLLEYNGQTISESMTIARFLAREFDLGGKTSWEQAKADMVGECAADTLAAAIGVSTERNEAAKAEKLEKFKTVTLPGFFKAAENLLAANGGKHFAGNDVTYGDLAVFNVLDGLEGFGIEWKAQTPALAKFYETIADIPEIKKYIETRP